MNPLHPVVAERANYRCEYCLAPEVAHGFAFEVEHAVPRAHGGGDDLGNLSLACRAHNVFKSDAVTAIDPDTGRAAPVFNPRADVWSDHFALGDDDRIIGRSPAGRATVVRLNMNADRQVAARGRWRAFGLLP